MRRYRWLWIALLALAALVPWGAATPDWLATLALPGRQTVPSTPHPTATRTQLPPTMTPLPTRPGVPTATLGPIAPSATATRGGTPAPETPSGPTLTSAPPTAPTLTPTAVGATATPTGPAATPGPWLWLNAQPVIVGPGSRVVIRVEAVNEGAEALADAVVTLSGVEWLTLGVLRPNQGVVEQQPGRILWRVGELAPGAGANLDMDVTVSDLVLPDGALTLRAALVWRGGGPLNREIALSLPWAPLPAVGDSR